MVSYQCSFMSQPHNNLVHLTDHIQPYVFYLQDILRSKPEGDSKLQELKRRGLSLSGQDLEGQKKQEVESRVRDAEDQWTGVLQEAKQALDQAEKQCAVEGRLREYKTLRESTRAWLQDKHQSLVSLDAQMDPEEKIMTAQVNWIPTTINMFL